MRIFVNIVGLDIEKKAMEHAADELRLKNWEAIIGADAIDASPLKQPVDGVTVTCGSSNNTRHMPYEP